MFQYIKHTGMYKVTNIHTSMYKTHTQKQSYSKMNYCLGQGCITYRQLNFIWWYLKFFGIITAVSSLCTEMSYQITCT